MKWPIHVKHSLSTQFPVWARLNVMRIHCIMMYRAPNRVIEKIFTMSADLSHHAMVPLTPESADCGLIHES